MKEELIVNRETSYYDPEWEDDDSVAPPAKNNEKYDDSDWDNPELFQEEIVFSDVLKDTAIHVDDSVINLSKSNSEVFLLRVVSIMRYIAFFAVIYGILLGTNVLFNI